MSGVTREIVLQHIEGGDWRHLQETAAGLVASAEHAAMSAMRPLLGGGTRLMLALGHRISDDIDLFIDSPQWIGYLTPRLTDEFPTGCADYEESASALKFKFPQGEVDFIVGMPLLGLPSERDPRCLFELEPVGEVIAKKLFYRGWALTPRDLLDWHAVGVKTPECLDTAQFGRLLSEKHLAALKATLSAMRTSAAAGLRWATLRAVDAPTLASAVQWAQDQIEAIHAARIRHLSQPANRAPSPSPSPGPGSR